MRCREIIKRINPTIIKKNGEMQSFKEQVFDLMEGNYNLHFPMVVDENSLAVGYLLTEEEAKRPLTMRPAKLIKVMLHHDLDWGMIAELPVLLEGSVLGIDSLTQPGSKVVVLDEVDNQGNQVIAALRLNLVSADIALTQVSSVYGKERFERFLVNTYEANKHFYKNEKTERFIRNTRLSLPNPLMVALSEQNGICKIKKSQLEKSE